MRHLRTASLALGLPPLILAAVVQAPPLQAQSVRSAPIINEFVFNHTGGDVNEYVEILGDPNTDYFDFSAIVIEGDASDPGRVDAVLRFGTTDARGLRTTLYRSGDLENGTQSVLLVEGFRGSQGRDVDTDDDGVIDNVLWTRIVDSVAVSDGDSADFTYGDLTFLPGFDGGSFTVGGASRIPDGNVTTGTVADFVRNDFAGEGIPGLPGSLNAPGDPPEALNTPADPNRLDYPSGGGAAPAGLTISAIQGEGHRSPFTGQTVAGVSGVITAVVAFPRGDQGFWLQTGPDGNRRTSEAVFVQISTNDETGPGLDNAGNQTILGLFSPGDAVVVSGKVEEDRPAASVDNLTVTQITANIDPLAQIDVTGAGIVEPTVIGERGFKPPKQRISKVEGHVDERDRLRRDEGIDFYESLEGMLLTVPEPLVVSPTNAFGEVFTLAGGGRKSKEVNDRGGITVDRKDFNPERIQIDDRIAFQGTLGLQTGDLIDEVTGVLSYDFGNYELLTLDPLVLLESADNRRETTPLEGGRSTLTVATFNLLNLGPGASEQLTDLGAIIADNLRAPDIIGLQEVQDNSGPTDDGTVAAGRTFRALIQAIEAAGGPTYDFAQVDPLDGEDGGQPGGNIRVGLLFRPDRVQLAPGRTGRASESTEVLSGPTLSLNPGRIDPTNPAFAGSRKPLAAAFEFSGRTLFVIVNHFNSKGGDQSLFGPSQPPAPVSENQRLEQAAVVAAFVDDILDEDRRANVVVLGDFNDFPFSAPIRVLERGPDQRGKRVLRNLLDGLKDEEAYTFIFDGNAQALDNILVSESLRRRAKVDVVHVDTEFLTSAGGGDPASDHDPIVARLALKGGKKAR
jgi:predicted extracellular nuclease